MDIFFKTSEYIQLFKAISGFPKNIIQKTNTITNKIYLAQKKRRQNLKLCRR